MNVFLDTNTVVDFMGEREGFFEDASFIFSMIYEGRINASMSVLTVMNCAYILRKAFDQNTMLEKIDVLCDLVEVLPIYKHHLQEAIHLKPHDYEDAVQYLSACSHDVDVIITRDMHGFKDFDILVMTPSEFVSKVMGE